MYAMLVWALSWKQLNNPLALLCGWMILWSGFWSASMITRQKFVVTSWLLFSLPHLHCAIYMDHRARGSNFHVIRPSIVRVLCWTVESREVWGHAPPENFRNLLSQRLFMVASKSSFNSQNLASHDIQDLQLIPFFLAKQKALRWDVHSMHILSTLSWH